MILLFFSNFERSHLQNPTKSFISRNEVARSYGLKIGYDIFPIWKRRSTLSAVLNIYHR